MAEERVLRRIGTFATESGHGRWAVADAALLEQKARDAAANPRKREIHRLHDGDADNPHRMINAIQPGSYVRPHRHVTPPKSESFVVLRGCLGFIQFEDDGSFLPENCVVLDAARGTYAVDARPGPWHGVVALAPDTVIFEVKPGPYVPGTDKDFAPFAPAEDDPAAQAYLASLEDRFREITGLGPRQWRL